VEPGQDEVDILVPFVLDGLEALGVFPVGRAGLEHLVEDADALDDLLRDPIEMGEIEIVLGQELFEHLDLLLDAAGQARGSGRGILSSSSAGDNAKMGPSASGRCDRPRPPRGARVDGSGAISLE
jgi:hypothetical protein